MSRIMELVADYADVVCREASESERWDKSRSYLRQLNDEKAGTLAALQAEVEKLEAAVTYEHDTCKAVEAERDALQADAARYRAIPKLDWYVGPEYNTYNDGVIDEYNNYAITKESLDAAIDKAIKELK